MKEFWVKRKYSRLDIAGMTLLAVAFMQESIWIGLISLGLLVLQCVFEVNE